MTFNEVRKFKGGSLSSTTLMADEVGNSFVRKSVSLVCEREYGFQRWYSQLKRLQRYSVLFPGVFPEVLRFGRSGQTAYFDLPYFEQAVNAQEYLEKCNEPDKVDALFQGIIANMNTIHEKKIQSNREAIELYVYEEIEQKIKDCYINESFVKFLKNKFIIFNGVKVKSFIDSLGFYKELCYEFYDNPYETYTHGNITLENILFLPEDERVIFIDPYEENIIDSPLAEFSQLLQSSNARYEMYNARNAAVEGAEITLQLPASQGLDWFNAKIEDYMDKNFSKKECIVIKLLEISQFIRMLPFKMNVDEEKMIFFYGLASYLFDRLVIRNKLEGAVK